MLGTEIDSEKKENVVETAGQIVSSTHCVLVMEPAALDIDAAAPVWRVSVELVLRDSVLGNEELRAMLPACMVGPVMHARQFVAVAHYPSSVLQWRWFFESSAPRAKAKVWLHPSHSLAASRCGIFVLPTLADRGVLP